MKKILVLTLFSLCCFQLVIAQQKRTFTNIKAEPYKDSTAIRITFDIQTDTVGQTFDILDIEYFSEKNQKWAKVTNTTPSFDQLRGVAPGSGKEIIWNTHARLLREGIRIEFIFKRINLPKATPTATGSDPFAELMVQIKGGTFTMGSPANEAERRSDERQHQVTLSDYKISKYEVTQAQWVAVMGSNPSYFKDCDNCPVEQVSWEDIQEFLKKLNEKTGKAYRLPTEAEWEYACRAGTSTPFHTGNNLTTAQANYDGNNPYNKNAKGEYRQKTTPVGSFAPNAWGLYDMHGNVWEWCSDWYGAYPTGAQTNPQGPSTGSSRGLRGGSWYYDARFCRSAYRNSYAPTDRNRTYGFRLASS